MNTIIRKNNAPHLRLIFSQGIISRMVGSNIVTGPPCMDVYIYLYLYMLIHVYVYIWKEEEEGEARFWKEEMREETLSQRSDHELPKYRRFFLGRSKY